MYFKYDPERDYVLKDLSFTVPSGKKAAIVGSSGSGSVLLEKNSLLFWEMHGSITE